MPIIEEQHASPAAAAEISPVAREADFHARTSLSQGVNHFEFERRIKEFLEQSKNKASRNFKVFAGRPTVELRPDLALLDISFAKLLERRKSHRAFKPTPMSLAAFSNLLSSAYGLTEQRRPVPSAGGLYPMDLYAFVFNVAGVSPGIYYFHPLENRLTLIKSGFNEENARQIQRAFPQISNPSGCLIVGTCVFERCLKKYGERGMRFVFTEAGHICQNIYLACAAMGLGCWTIGGARDVQIAALLGLNRAYEGQIFTVSVGTLT